MGGRTLVLLRKSVYVGCTFERVKLRSLGIADFIDCRFIDCDFNTAFIAASFSNCKFIGNVHGCVFCGTKYDSYYYGDRLSYLISNRGQLQNVDFSEANFTDMDFRGGIDLSTTKFPMDMKSTDKELKKKYCLRIITKDYIQQIDGVKEFICHAISDDISAEVEFGNYIEYWKMPEHGVLTVMLTTVMPFDILRDHIAQQWHPADRNGNSFVADSRTMEINCKQISWISIDLED